MWDAPWTTLVRLYFKHVVSFAVALLLVGASLFVGAIFAYGIWLAD